jgi:hypothetical protein
MIEIDLLGPERYSDKWECRMAVVSLGLLSCRLEEGRRGVVHRSRGRAGYRLEEGVCGIDK